MKKLLTKAEYAERAQALCVLPDVYLRLKEIMEDDCSSLQDVAEIIQLDPALSVTLLKLANSAMFSFPRKVDSIAHALTILGMKETRNIVEMYGLTCAFSSLDNSVINIDSFWEISVDCALICKYFTQEKGLKSHNLFLSGLLHNIGELAILYSDVERVLLCRDFDKKITPWEQQMLTYGFTYDECSVELLNLWQVPESITAPIQSLQNIHITSQPNEDNLCGQLLYLASRLAIVNYHPGLYAKKVLISEALLNQLDLSWDDIENAINFCNAEGIAILSALKLKH